MDLNMQFYELDGDCIVPIDAEKWPGPQQLGDKTIRNARVSTVFLGIQHHGGIFETMVFGGPLDSYMARTHTLAEAHKMHCLVVDVLTQASWLEWYLDGNAQDRALQRISDGKNTGNTPGLPK